MEILLARDMGFCFGVRRAIDIMERAADETGRDAGEPDTVKGEIASLGDVVHNPQVVDYLSQRGVKVVNQLSEVPEGRVAITAHGVGPQVLQEVQERGLAMVDATCPIVTRSQRWAQKLAREGFAILIFGDANHREVRGVLAWAGGKGIAITEEGLDSLAFTPDPPGPTALPGGLPSKIAVMSQTTQSPQRFAAFVAKLLETHIDRISELRVINTLCGVTSNQQAAAQELAQQVQVMIVIGGRNSANTRHLAEVCQEEGVATYHIEAAAELEAAWLQGVERVGVTAGASTPDFVIEEVVARLRELSQQ